MGIVLCRRLVFREKFRYNLLKYLTHLENAFYTLVLPKLTFYELHRQSIGVITSVIANT